MPISPVVGGLAGAVVGGLLGSIFGSASTPSVQSHFQCQGCGFTFY
ncbi:hypothetical protein NYZ78_15860 [Acinetobacter baumannii]|nr:hypothetical protein [Acinetobacter baumannii]